MTASVVPEDSPIVHPLPRGTFLMLGFMGFLSSLVSMVAVGAIVYIAVQGKQPHAILGALAMTGRDDLLKLGEAVFRWTRGVPDRMAAK